MLTVLCTDMGAAQALIPVIRKVKNVQVLADSRGQAKIALKKAGIPFKSLTKKQVIPLGDALLTSTTPIQREKGKIVHYGREAEAWHLAKHKKIPSLAVMDKYTKTEVFDLFTEVVSGGKVFPDKVCLPHDFALKEMLKLGFARKHLTVTGNPHFDNVKRKAKRKYKQRIIPVFLSSQRYMLQAGMDNLPLLKVVVDAVTDADVIVKPHPKDTAATIKKYQKCGAIIDKTSDTEELVLSMREDEFCTGSASTVLEFATFANKLAVSIQLGATQEDMITNVMNITPHAYSAHAAKTLIKQALHNATFRSKWGQRRKKLKQKDATKAVLKKLRKGI
ncbi:MAG: hypothetical protein QF486_05655 [Candidatus Woesearchaeota archaeon]|nr:hypothetical protein [Candidatus Woesearchaeota archaeon]MDP7199073.1 hypothetical protein [Candidatus Woesearchaeota archaeon]MDP7467783.1 hypothetical protein [Candidatus Woesearchaeota archaeon]MDP7646486.1 hypothetical protein [Candidatus Woesearchaeota archaeon]